MTTHELIRWQQGTPWVQRARLVLITIWAMIVVTLRRLFRGRAHPAWTWSKELIAHVLRRETRSGLALSVERFRARQLDAPIPRSVARRVTVEVVEVEGLAAEITTPETHVPGDPVVMFLHGGGYVYCSPGTHRDIVSRIAVAAGARCVSLHYSLAPEHPFPAAIDECARAFLRLARDAGGAGRLILAGDSAGGGLALATMLRLREERRPLPAAGVLLSPWVDLSCSASSIDDNADTCYLVRHALESCAEHYLQGHPPSDGLASPVHADLAGLPPLLIHTGDAEAIHAEILQLARRAEAAGVQVTLEIGAGMFHVFTAFASVLPEGRPYISRIGAFIREHAGEGGGAL